MPENKPTLDGAQGPDASSPTSSSNANGSGPGPGPDPIPPGWTPLTPDELQKLTKFAEDGAAGFGVGRGATDERCWFKCKQENGRRAAGQPPKCSCICYINLRDHVRRAEVQRRFESNLNQLRQAPGSGTSSKPPQPSPNPTPVPVRDALGTDVSPGSATEERSRYHWDFLDYRYIYYAKGIPAITKHMDDMGKMGVPGMEEMVKDLRSKRDAEKEAMMKGTRDERIARTLQALATKDDANYENLISISHLFSSNLDRAHNHLVRIFGPGLRNLSRLPESFQDGSQLRTWGTFWTKIKEGDGLKLGARMLENTRVLLEKIAENVEKRRNNRGGGGEPPGPFPPVPPGPGGAP